MKKKTRTTRARSQAPKSKLPKKRRAMAAKKLQEAPPPREPVTEISPPVGEKKIATMPNRTPGMKADINTRFASADDYQKVKESAAAAGVSMNKFIVEAALERTRKPVNRSGRIDPAAEPVATAG